MKNDGYKRVVDNKMRGFGVTDLKRKIIKVNKYRSRRDGRKGELLDTIVHEEMHAKHPKMHEFTVRRKTRKAMETLNYKQKSRYYSRYK